MLRSNLWFGCFLDFKTYTCAEMFGNERKRTFINMLLKLNIKYISFGFFLLLLMPKHAYLDLDYFFSWELSSV